MAPQAPVAARHLHSLKEPHMLLMKPSCECCDRDLAPDAEDAMICSFECTWCRNCATTCLDSRCPNCGGTLAPRPTRSQDKLAANPAATERTHQPGLHRS
jgi:hypothetical protein